MSLLEHLAAAMRAFKAGAPNRTVAVKRSAEDAATLRAIRRATAADPTTERYTLLAEELARQGDVASAQRVMGRAHRLAGGQLTAHQSLIGGLISSRFGDLNRAEIFLSRTLSIDPSSHMATYALGSLLAQRGAFVAAARLFRRDVPVMTGNGTPTYTRILCVDDEAGPKAVALPVGLSETLGGGVDSSDTRPIYFVAADSVYFRRYSRAVLESLRASDIPMRLVAHIVNPDEESLRLARDLLQGSQDVTFSFEQTRLGSLDESQRKTYFSVVRYLRLPELLATWNVPVIVADIDQVMMGSPRSLFALCEKDDVAVLYFDSQLHNILSVVSATAMVVSSTAAAAAFCTTLASRTSRALADTRRLGWHLDQAILALTALQSESAGIRVGHIPPALVHLSDDDPFVSRKDGGAVLRSLSSLRAKNPALLSRLLGEEESVIN